MAGSMTRADLVSTDFIHRVLAAWEYDSSGNVAKTAKDVRERLTDRGEEVVDGVIIAAATARERALESDDEDEKPRATGRQGPPARRR